MCYSLPRFKQCIAFFPVILFSFFTQLSAQDHQLDSLEQLFKTSKGTDRVDLSLEIANYLNEKNSDEALKNAIYARDESVKLNYQEGVATANLVLCKVYNTQSKFDLARENCDLSLETYRSMADQDGIARVLKSYGSIEQNLGNYFKSREYLLEALAISQKSGNKALISEIYHNIGLSYYFQNKVDSSLFYHQLSLEMSKDLGDKSLISKALFHIGINYSDLKYDDRALDYILQALKMNEELNDEAGMAAALNSIGLIYKQNGDHDKALEYQHRSLELHEKLDKKRGTIIVMNNLAVIYQMRGDLEKSLDFLQRALELSQSIQYKRGLTLSYGNIAEVYKDQKDYDKAIEYDLLSLKLNTESGSIGEMGKSNLNLAKIYLEIDELETAEDYLEKAIALCTEGQSILALRDAYFTLSNVNEKQGKYRESLVALKQAEFLEDSVSNEEKTKSLTEQQVRYETEKKEQQLALLSQQKKVDTLWRYVLIGSLVVLAVLGFLIYRYMRFKAVQHKKLYEEEHKVSKQLQELDAMKSRFFTNISHEFRTPLTLIKGPVDSLLGSVNEEQRGALLLIKRNANKLLKLVNQLLDLSKIESHKMELHTSPQSIVPFIRRITMLFSSHLERKKIKLDWVEPPEDITVYFDEEKLEHVVENLLSNAVKWTPEGGKIIVSSEKTLWAGRQCFKLSVKDNGPGIPEESLPYIFDRFYQSSSQEQVEGTGIGLALAKELVELHHGQIQVVSKLRVGSEFMVLLPLGKEHLQENEINLFKANDIAFPDQVEKAVEINYEKINDSAPDESCLVLLVEDNEDVRLYLEKILRRKFKLSLAVDGIDGWNKILDSIPDLIVSDVMMPGLNGLELCKRIKSDSRTSHIPVILLTAKASEEDKIEGLQYRANDYLMKPFNEMELILKIENLLSIRKEMRSKFSNPEIKPNEIGLSSLDEVFVEKLKQNLEEHHSNERYGIEEMSKEMGMSRSLLHRKILAMTGQAPSMLLRKFRLERALMMLKKQTGTISEISYQVGFSSPAYFTKCFSEEYGYTPKEIMKH